MDFLELAKERFSVRSYDLRPVEEEKLEKVLEAARIAPTGCNKQAQRIYVLQSEAARAKAATACKMLYGAPVVLLVCYDVDEVWKTPAGDYNVGEQDCAIVTTHMMLEAAELGLGSVWIRGFDAAELIRAMELPENIKPVCMLDLGYPSEKAAPSAWHGQKKEIGEFVAVL